MKTSAATAAVTASLVVLTGAPALAMDELPPTRDMSSAQINRLGDKYLRIVCPANRTADKLTRALERAWGNKVNIRYGTPVPSSVRVLYRKYAKALSREGQRLNAAAWPEDLIYPIKRIVRADFKNVAYYESRDTATVRRSWQRQQGSAGGAPNRIRITLELPPAGRGC